MAKLICSAKDIGFTILPYYLDTPLERELISRPSDYVIGYITTNNETGKLTFTYTESGVLTEVSNHWSLSIINNFTYREHEGQWIVYCCSPVEVKSEFNKVIRTDETVNIYNWDTWSVEGKNSKVAVVTSLEIF
jgi:hypothetical protein